MFAGMPSLQLAGPDYRIHSTSRRAMILTLKTFYFAIIPIWNPCTLFQQGTQEIVERLYLNNLCGLSSHNGQSGKRLYFASIHAESIFQASVQEN